MQNKILNAKNQKFKFNILNKNIRNARIYLVVQNKNIRKVKMKKDRAKLHYKSIKRQSMRDRISGVN